MKTLLTTICTFFLLNGFAQGSIEQALLKPFKKITYWAHYQGDNIDSLERANDDFREMLLKYTSLQPLTIGFDFKGLEKEGLSIATSSDGLFRIYSWDTYTGGTMHYFDNVYQFKANGKVYSKTIRESTEEGDPGYWYSTIYSLNNGGKTYYLGLRHAIYSTSDAYQGVKAFSIGSNSLNADTKLIQTKTGLRNALGFEFDFFSVKNQLERPVRLIKYDAAAKTLSFPVVLQGGKVTSRNIVYRFTGQSFEQEK
jgi:hypothetical protein